MILWAALAALQDPISIPENFQGWKKTGAWTWQKQTLRGAAEATLDPKSCALLLRDAPGIKFEIEFELKADADPSLNVLIPVHFKKHDVAIMIDFEKSKPTVAAGMACATGGAGAVAFYGSFSVPLEDIDWKDWVKIRVAVDEALVLVHINDRRFVSSDMADLLANQDKAAKDAYARRAHKGVGLGIWNQAAGGKRVSAEFRGFKLTPSP
jgi:hypothetical protein